MTREMAARIQELWQKEGNKSCEHEHLKLERTESGYLTGNYFCLACGAEISGHPMKGHPRPPTA